MALSKRRCPPIFCKRLADPLVSIRRGPQGMISRGEHPQGHLATYSGILQADAYDGYNRLYLAGRAPGPIYEVT